MIQNMGQPQGQPMGQPMHPGMKKGGKVKDKKGGAEPPHHLTVIIPIMAPPHPAVVGALSHAILSHPAAQQAVRNHPDAHQALHGALSRHFGGAR